VSLIIVKLGVVRELLLASLLQHREEGNRERP
jgi:hypothetical protein